MPKDFQPALAGGELTPSLHSRVDLVKYQTGLALAQNVFVRSQGGVASRSGFEFVGYVPDDARAHRVIPFRFNTEQAYALVFGHLTMNVTRNGALVLDPTTTAITGITQAPLAVISSTGHGKLAGDKVFLSGIVGMEELNDRWLEVIAPVNANDFRVAVDTQLYGAWSSGGTVASAYEIATPYDEADLFRLKFAQDADVMTLVMENYAPRNLSRLDHDDWSLDVFDIAPDLEVPLAESQLTAIGSSPPSTTKLQRYIVTAIINGVESQPSNYARNTQSGGVIRTITGLTLGNPTEITLDAPPVEDQRYFLQMTGTHPVNAYLDEVVVIAKNVVGNTMDIYREAQDETAIDTTLVTGSGTVGGTTRDPTWVASFTLSSVYGSRIQWRALLGGDPDFFNIYREESPNSGIFGFIGETLGDRLFFDNYNLGPDMTVTPPTRTVPFQTANEYPDCVEYHQQRLAFGGGIDTPERIVATRTADYDNFDTSRPLRDDDALDFTLKGSEVNQIRHLVELDDLIVFTSGAEFRIQGDQNNVLTPSSFVPRKQGTRGSSHVRPVVIGESIIFVQERGARVRDLAFTFENDKYTGNDLSIMAEHLFHTYQIVDWAYSQEPHSLIWVVRNDGVMLSLSYLREHQIWAWCQHHTDGFFESVCSIPEGDEDIVYAVIRRNIDGNEVRFIERMHERSDNSIIDSFCVDCGSSLEATRFDVINVNLLTPFRINTSAPHGLTDGDSVYVSGLIDTDETITSNSIENINNQVYTVSGATPSSFRLLGVDGADFTSVNILTQTIPTGAYIARALTTVSGLDQLEGQTVACLADGNVIEDLTVSNGAIELPVPAATAHIGKPYECIIKTLPLDSERANIHGRKKSVREVTLRTRNTRGLEAGPNLRKMTEYKDRTPQSGYGALDGAAAEQRVQIKPSWTDFGDFYVRQAYPLPVEILALLPEFDV